MRLPTEAWVIIRHEKLMLSQLVLIWLFRPKDGDFVKTKNKGPFLVALAPPLKHADITISFPRLVIIIHEYIPFCCFHVLSALQFQGLGQQDYQLTAVLGSLSALLLTWDWSDRCIPGQWGRDHLWCNIVMINFVFWCPGTQATLYVPRTVLEALRLHLFQGPPGTF